jgi:hypothetical protein
LERSKTNRAGSTMIPEMGYEGGRWVITCARNWNVPTNSSDGGGEI